MGFWRSSVKPQVNAMRSKLEKIIAKLDGVLHREENNMSNANRHEFEESLDFLDQFVLASKEKKKGLDNDAAFAAGWNAALAAVANEIEERADDTVWLNENTTVVDAVYHLRMEADVQLTCVEKPSEKVGDSSVQV